MSSPANRRPMGEVVAFPRPVSCKNRTITGYTEAELERAEQCVTRMMADGCTEEFAYEVAVTQLKIMRGGCRGD